MSELAHLFLGAWYQSIAYQQEMMPELAQMLAVPVADIFYRWKMRPKFKSTGTVEGTDWRYFFHGLNTCDLEHVSDGRFLQVTFGPGGRFDVFSGWGTLQFVMASKSPWPEFSELKEYLAEESPPYNHLSGSHAKMVSLLEQIEPLGLLERAAPELYALKEKHTIIDDDGRSVVKLPEELIDFTQPIFWDISVCGALVLTEKGQKLFSSNAS